MINLMGSICILRNFLPTRSLHTHRHSIKKLLFETAIVEEKKKENKYRVAAYVEEVLYYYSFRHCYGTHRHTDNRVANEA